MTGIHPEFLGRIRGHLRAMSRVGRIGSALVRCAGAKQCSRWLRKNLLPLLEGLYYNGNPSLSWSQHGEDAVLAHLLPDKGTYVDVGAHHPFRHSVTNLLYQRGWSGVSIDVTESMETLFPKVRNRDFNFFGLASDSTEPLTLFRFLQSEVNTVDAVHADLSLSAGLSLIATEKIVPETLDQILSMSPLPDDASIDFLSIDAEGHDYFVLKSIDLDKWRVGSVLIEETKDFPDRAVKIQTYLEGFGFNRRIKFAESVYYERIVPRE